MNKKTTNAEAEVKEVKAEQQEPVQENQTTQEATEATETAKDPFKELTEKYDELNDTYLRLRADFDNFRKRTLKEKAELIKNGGETALTSLLPVIDDFERALQVMSQSDVTPAEMEGINLIYAKFQAYLKQNNVKQMECIGKPFDVEFHEALTVIPAPEEEMKGKIIDCIQQGYILNDKVIRFAKVIVGE
ncbi:MAG: nucleotide exchange factor GrpE [Bacteroidales bacterium]|nr:nucleotide exchange factor GrpE [Bacteroidales bacterium]MDD3161742.1 nucleotide exchange factor GrpE [Bacteroidales bacterium]